ncbi:MAG: hypothetical protein WCP71_03265 [Actinomycetes bacterium]
MKQGRSAAIGALALIILIIGGGWFFKIAPQLDLLSSIQRDQSNVLASNARNQLVLTKLKTDYQNIGDLKSEFALLGRSIPANASISAFISELNSVANKHSTTIKSILVSDAKPYSVDTRVPTDSGVKEPPRPVGDPRITGSNFVIIPIQITASGKYPDVLDFINSIQTGERLFLISSLSSAGSMGNKPATTTAQSASNKSGKVDASIGGFIYVLLD